MTLIELVIAIAISSIILAATFAAMIAGLRNTKATETRLTESHDVQLVESHLPQDLQSATQVLVGPAATGCASASGTNLVTLRWAETLVDTSGLPASTTHFEVSYRIVGLRHELVRYSCRGTANPPGTAAHRLTVAHNVLSGAAMTCGSRIEVTIEEESGYVYAITGNTRTAIAGATLCPPGTTTTTTIPPSTTLFNPDPAILEVEVRDIDEDGTLDRLIATFSKPLPAECGGAAAAAYWTLTNAPADAMATNVAVSGYVATVTVTGDTVDTAAAGMLVDFNPVVADGCVADAFAGEQPTDQMSPVVLSVESRDPTGGPGDGLAAQDDMLVITFSEPLPPLQNPSVVVTEEGNGTISGAATSLTITGITDGPLPIGNGYFDGTGASGCCTANWAATASMSGAELIVQLTGPCAPVDDCTHLDSGSGTFRFVPSPSLTDGELNPVINPERLPSTAAGVSFQVF